MSVFMVNLSEKAITYQMTIIGYLAAECGLILLTRFAFVYDSICLGDIQTHGATTQYLP